MKIDVIIIGAGAAGLMCGIEAGARWRRVLILEKSNKPGKKILMSGGGRCNFTNLNTTPDQYISQNQHFCKSALSRYTQWSFIDLIERYKISYYEKTLGQLFCEHKSSQIVDMLLAECKNNNVDILLNQTITSVDKLSDAFIIKTQTTAYQCKSLVVASGGLSIPTLGSSPFGYQIATQFGLNVHPTRAGLVPFTLHTEDKLRFEGLSGISVDSLVTCNGKSFHEQLLFTHRGLSGPSVLQISSYWRAGDEVVIKLLPNLDLYSELLKLKDGLGLFSYKYADKSDARELRGKALERIDISKKNSLPNGGLSNLFGANTDKVPSTDSYLKTVLANYFAKRLLSAFIEQDLLDKPLKQCTIKELRKVADSLQNWIIKPNGTEGYRTAEVTLGGVDCDELSSKSFEAKKVPGLFFIGEVIDVSGWLGGYNFQWAWASGWAAGQVV